MIMEFILELLAEIFFDGAIEFIKNPKFNFGLADFSISFGISVVRRAYRIYGNRRNKSNDFS